MYSYRTLTFNKGILRLSNPLKEIDSHLKHQLMYYVFIGNRFALVMSVDVGRKYYINNRHIDFKIIIGHR